MDATLPLTPDLDGFRAKVLAVKPRKVYVCCICHHNLIRFRHGGDHVCTNPDCLAEARALGWTER